MILLFKKGSVFTSSNDPDKAGSIFPLLTLPTNVEGTPTDLNDFQWWSYSDKWQQWLKKNPRSWTAEAESFFAQGQALLEELEQVEDFYRQFFDFQLGALASSGQISGFGDFLKVYEAEENSGEVNQRFIRFMYALEALEKSGKLKDKMQLDALTEGEEYAVVFDPFDEEGRTVPEGRQAIKFKKIKDTSKLVIAEATYSIPLEKEMKTDARGYLLDVAKFTTQVLTAGIGLAAVIIAAKAAGSVAGSMFLWKKAKGLFKGNARAKTVAPKGTWESIKNLFKGGPSLAGKTIKLPNGVFVKDGIPYVKKGGKITKLGGAVGKNAIKRAGLKLSGKAGGKTAAKAGTKAFGRGVSKFLGPIGLGLAAVDIIQSSYNWFSSKQAPRYGEVDDFASKVFEPGKIQTGKPITVCWTNDAGGGWASYVFSTDTRTTMDLIKVAQTGGLSYFMLIDVHSKELKKLVTENELVMLVFNSDDKFEHGFFDNDDLEFETIALQSMDEHKMATSFYGYCDWSDMESAYAEAPDKTYFVPEDAPGSYEFNFQNQEGEKLNVSGKLMTEQELESFGVERLLPDFFGTKNQNVKEDNEFSDFSSPTLNENLSVVSFNEFYKILEAEDENQSDEESNPILNPFGRKKEENKKDSKTSDVPGADELERKWIEEFEGSEKIQAERERVVQVRENSPYSRVSLPIYRVSTIEYVDPEIKDQAPSIAYFVVGDESLQASPGEPIVVEVTSDDAVYNPRFGLATFEPTKKSEPEPESKEDEDEIEPLKPGSSEDGKVKASPKDIEIVDKKRKLIIKDDPSPSGEDVNTADKFLTADQRKELGIENWKNVTKVTLVYDRDKKPTKVILRNKEAGILGDRIRRIRKGQAGFDAAVKFAEEIKDRISYK